MLTDDSRPDETPIPGGPTEVEQLRALIYTDDLTGLYNRRFFRHCIAEQKTQSDTSVSPFALLMMDVDHFKQINDTYGHAVGDAALIQIAKLLKKLLRYKGWVFRYAGDEFVAILRQCDEEQAKAVCSQILKQIAAGLRQKGSKFPLTTVSLSIGYAIYPKDSSRISELLEVSDRALYVSKRKGKNTVTSGREMLNLEKAHAGEWPIRAQCQSLIGRQKEWNLLRYYFSECKNGHGRLILLTGEAGIGKSRLLNHFTHRQRTGDYHILYGGCNEGTIIHSYAPIRDALKKGFEAKDPVTIRAYKDLENHYRSELIALVPQFDRFEKKPPIHNKPNDRYFLLEGILLLLRNLSHQLPTVFIVEDIHWSDESTLNLLHYLARYIRNERILIIATFREEEAVHSHLPSVLQNMSRENLFETISLPALTEEETTIMVEDIFQGYHVPPAFQQWIYKEAEGNPFYVEELIQLLLEEGYIQRSNHEVELQKPDKSLLPYSIRALIQRRISRLDDSLKRVLGYASIIGYEFELDILAKLIEENEGYLLDLLDRLTKMQLIGEISEKSEEAFAFAHNKIRDVIYDDMGVIKRRKFHQRVGEILENMHSEDSQLYAEDLAYHFEHAGDVVKTCTYSLEAGKKALKIHAYNDALMHLNRCFQFKDLHIELVGCPTEQLADLYTHKGLALEALGLWEEATGCYELLLQLKGKEPHGVFEPDALNHLSRVSYKQDDFSRSMQLAEQALDSATKNHHAVGILNSYDNLAKNYWRTCSYAKALQNMKLAVEIADQQKAIELKAKFLNSTGIMFLEQYDFGQAQTCLQEALEIFQQQQDKPGIIECLVNLSIIRHLQGDLHEARQQLVNAFAVAQEIGDPFGIANCSVNQAELELKLGNYEMGSRLNERAGRIYNELDHSLGLTYYLENEAHLNMVKGRLDAAIEATLKARHISVEKSFLKRTLELLRNESTIRFFQGYFQDALGCLEQVISGSDAMGDMVTKAEAELKQGIVYFALGDHEQALARWKSVQIREDVPSAGSIFWKTAASAFLAALQKNEHEALALQSKMHVLAEKTDSYLIPTALLLSCHQLQILGRLQEALEITAEAEKHAAAFEQDLWLIRSKIKAYELEHELGRTLDPEKLRQLLVASQQQGQHEVIHRCYRLLAISDSGSEGLSEDWQKHWSVWQDQIPEPYRSSFRPTLD